MKSIYKHVYLRTLYHGKKALKPYHAVLCINGFTWNKYFVTEREAALAVDMKLIEMGKEPVNILKHK